MYFVLCLILFFMTASANVFAAKAMCFYDSSDSDFIYTCSTFCDLAEDLGYRCEEQELSGFPFYRMFIQPDDIIYIASHGSRVGVLQGHVTYKDIASIKSYITIVDACYAGYLMDEDTQAEITITSTGKCLVYKQTFIEALKCFVHPEDCITTYVYCTSISNMNFGKCQMYIGWLLYTKYSIDSISFVQDGYNICIGTALIKDKYGVRPWVR